MENNIDSTYMDIIDLCYQLPVDYLQQLQSQLDCIIEDIEEKESENE